jgi:hypothetical protein
MCRYPRNVRFPLPPVASPIGDTSLIHVMKLAAHSTTSPTPTAMRQSFIMTLYKKLTAGLSSPVQNNLFRRFLRWRHHRDSHNCRLHGLVFLCQILPECRSERETERVLIFKNVFQFIFNSAKCILSNNNARKNISFLEFF